MEKRDIIESLKVRCSAMFNLLQEKEDLLTADSVDEFEYTFVVDQLKAISGEISQHINGLKGYKYHSMIGKIFDNDLKVPLKEDEVKNKNNIFFGKKVVMTGNLVNFPSRQTVAEMLHILGADINGSISKNTDIVVMGNGAGPAKVKKIEELKKAGHEIRIIMEEEFVDLMNEYSPFED